MNENEPLSLGQLHILDLIDKLPKNEREGIVRAILHAEILQRQYVFEQGQKDLAQTIGSSESREGHEDLLYLGLSNYHGTFSEKEFSREYKEGGSYYKINIRTKEIYYIPSQFDEIAIKNMVRYLSPCCDIVNPLDEKTAKGIEIISPGKVFFSYGRRVIDQSHKIKIRLI